MLSTLYPAKLDLVPCSLKQGNIPDLLGTQSSTTMLSAIANAVMWTGVSSLSCQQCSVQIQ